MERKVVPEGRGVPAAGATSLVGIGGSCGRLRSCGSDRRGELERG